MVGQRRLVLAGKAADGPARVGGGGGRKLAEMGAIFAGARRPIQARIDVMLALGAGMSVAELREMLESL